MSDFLHTFVCGHLRPSPCPHRIRNLSNSLGTGQISTQSSKIESCATPPPLETQTPIFLSPHETDHFTTLPEPTHSAGNPESWTEPKTPREKLFRKIETLFFHVFASSPPFKRSCQTREFLYTQIRLPGAHGVAAAQEEVEEPWTHANHGTPCG
uniref:(northern house mosquito) hypothetical protein n=1 Tax=Culex pipiens TaxID=7175 RepID=A0A8D8C4R9_CULPI